MIDSTGAAFYAGQLYNLLAAEDPAMVLGNPFTRAVLLSLLQDLSAMVDGAFGDMLIEQTTALRAQFERARTQAP